MASIPASVTLVDAGANNHVFKHKSHTTNELVMLDTTSGLSAVSRPWFSIAKIPSKDKNVRKVRAKVYIPHVEAPAGTTAEGYVAEPRKVGESFFVGDFVLHNRASDDTLITLRKFATSVVSADLGLLAMDDLYTNDQLFY
jgi:hypothetical protein